MAITLDVKLISSFSGGSEDVLINNEKQFDLIINNVFLVLVIGSTPLFSNINTDVGSLFFKINYYRASGWIIMKFLY